MMLNSPVDGQSPAPFTDEQAADSFLTALNTQGG